MDLWPLLTDDHFSGDYSIERQLRPRVAAHAVRSGDVDDAAVVVQALCETWSGGSMPLLPVMPDSDLDDRWYRLLLRSSVDGIEGRKLISDDVVNAHSDMYATATQDLIRQLVELEHRPVVQTCRGIAIDDPWLIAYLSVFGDFADKADKDRNRRNYLRDDLKISDLVEIRDFEVAPSAQGLLDSLHDNRRQSAVELTRERLTAGRQGGFNRGLPGSSRFSWGANADAVKYGPNILVVYEPGSIEDLALIWNLRARFLHPRKLPLAIPLTDSIHEDIDVFSFGSGSRHHFGFGHDVAITSFSVGKERLKKIADGSDFDVVDPWNVLGEVHGYFVASTETVQFTDSVATIAEFSPAEQASLGQSFLGSSNATWLTLTTTLDKMPLPVSATMRRTKYRDCGYLRGYMSHVGKLTDFTRIFHPSGKEVLDALANDRGLVIRPSAPGKAAEQVMTATDGQLSMLLSSGISEVLSALTRRGHASLVKRRLNQFLEGSEVIEGSDKYATLADRLDDALGQPDLEEIGYMKLDRIRTTCGLSAKATNKWVEWAVDHRILLRGVEARCRVCGHAQWRPLADTLPQLNCHGCGRVINNPFGQQKIDYQYRASETLLRAMNYDVLPCILAIRHLSKVLDRSSVFGAYPGVEILEPGSNDPLAEIDVLLVLTDGTWIIGECKTNARGLAQSDLTKLWAAADRVDAIATFAATMDRASNCDPLWKTENDDAGRPHFALTAEHLYDVQAIGPTYGEEYFDWRNDYRRWGHNELEDSDDAMRQAFGDYLLRIREDASKWVRAPWEARD